MGLEIHPHEFVTFILDGVQSQIQVSATLPTPNFPSKENLGGSRAGLGAA